MNHTWTLWVLTLSLMAVTFLPTRAAAEMWSSFSKLIGESDYIAQYQVLVRAPKPDDVDLREDAGEHVIGSRLVRIYWKSKDFQDSLLPRHDKPWGAADYNRKTDGVRTAFVFYGRGQQLWTATAERGVIQYPGSTAWSGVGDEFSGSEVEFDHLLKRTAALKATGTKLECNLEMSVFGEKRLAK